MGKMTNDQKLKPKPVSTTDFADLAKILDADYTETAETPTQAQARMLGADIGALNQLSVHTQDKPVAAYRDGGRQITEMMLANRNPLARFLGEMERMSRIGMEPPMIAARLGFKLPQFVECLQRWPENARALEMGRAMGIEDYAMALHRQGAIGGVPGAMTLYLKSKGGFLATTESNVTVTFAGSLQGNAPALIDASRIDDAFSRHTALLDRMAEEESKD